MIVWLNTDGSVGEIVSSYVLTDSDGNEYSAFSQREGNLAAGGIFVYFEGGAPTGGLAYSTWEAPDKTVLSAEYQASWKKDCTIGLDKSRDMRKFKAEKAYEMQYFPFPDGLISEGGSGVYRVAVHDSITTTDETTGASKTAHTWSFGPILFSVADNAVVKETTLTKTEYAQLIANIESKADKSTLQADYQLQYSSTNVRGYASYAEAKEDLANLAVGQKVLANTKSLYGNPADELYEVVGDDEGNKGLINSTIGYKGLSNYYVWKFDSGTSETQSIYTGFVSRFYDTDGNARVLFGTDQVTDGYGFFANVLDASGNYTGAISLGAKNYKFAYDSLVDVFSSDGNTTAIKSPMGSASVSLTNGQVDIVGTAIYYSNDHTPTTHVFKGMTITFNTYYATFNCVGAVNFNNGSVLFNYEPPTCSKTPSSDSHLANKSYVDKTADSKAAEYANIEKQRAEYYEGYLQDQVDAINKSQNFVATVATHQDLVNIDVSKLDYSDCVLILKDEDHLDQSTVYRYKGGSGGVLDMFEFVGELGDYYTKAQINEKVNALNASITSAETECKAYADTEVGKAKDALRYFYLDEEGYLCLDYDKITA